jgi:CubicO group peptidase (beta-lactamase class C family)
MFNRSIVALTLVVGLAVSSASRGLQEQHPDFSQLERVLLEELKETNTPGATVAIVSDDRLIYSKAFGISNIETGTPMTTNMLFRIGSTTKMFTATALVTLAQQGKLKLDQPVGKYVEGLNSRVGSVTAHQLLTHTAGIIDEAPMYGDHDDSAMGRTIRGWKDNQLFTEPGKIISYSNPGYWLAGYVVESISGKPYADQLSEMIFKPVGMTSTTFRPTVAMTYPLAQGHNSTGKTPPTVARPFADNAASWPAGSMFTNVLDLSRFVIALLNNGKLEGNQVLLPEVIAQISTPHVSIQSQPDSKYGYGLMISNYRGLRIVEHGGSRSGYGSVIKMAPDYRFGVIVLGNRTGVALNKTADKAMELMLPLKPAPAQNKSDLPMSASEMNKCVGKFGQREVTAEILVRDGRLVLKMGGSELPVRKIGDNRFAAGPSATNQTVEFALVPDSSGKIEYFQSGLRSQKRLE